MKKQKHKARHKIIGIGSGVICGAAGMSYGIVPAIVGGCVCYEIGKRTSKKFCKKCSKDKFIRGIK